MTVAHHYLIPAVGMSSVHVACTDGGWCICAPSVQCTLPMVRPHDRQVAFLAIMSTSADWTRRRTPKSDDWIYLPTVYPADSYITMRPRGAHAAATSA